MLLRAGFLYILGAASLLLGALAAWQGLQLATLKDGAVTLAERTARTQRDLAAARLEAEAAQRRALVAEDKLARAGTATAADRGSGQSGAAAVDSTGVEMLRRDLADAQRERDAARTEAHQLAGELATLHSAGEGSGADNAEDAQSARDKAQKLSGELEIARAEVLRLSGELETANKALAEAHGLARDIKDAQAGVADRATQDGTGSLGVTAAPVAPTSASITPAPLGVKGKAASGARQAAPKRKEAKRKKQNPPQRHIESSIFTPF